MYQSGLNLSPILHAYAQKSTKMMHIVEKLQPMHNLEEKDAQFLLGNLGYK